MLLCVCSVVLILKCEYGVYVCLCVVFVCLISLFCFIVVRFLGVGLVDLLVKGWWYFVCVVEYVVVVNCICCVCCGCFVVGVYEIEWFVGFDVLFDFCEC